MLLTMSQKPRIKLPKMMAWSVWRLLSTGAGKTHDADEIIEAGHQLPIEP